VIVRAASDSLARTLRCRSDQAESVVRDERSARASFTRRGLFRAAGAVAAGTCFSDNPWAGWTFDIRAVQGPTYVARRQSPGVYVVEFDRFAPIAAGDYLFLAGDSRLFEPGMLLRSSAD
jgi:hypothetical protein